MSVNDKRKKYLKKKLRTKKSLGNLGKYPRLVVFKSNRHIYGQLLDDNKNLTLFSSSSMDNDLRKKLKSKSKMDKSMEVGYTLAEKIKSNKIKKVVFDRNGYQFHGRVKALVEALKEKGVSI